MLPAPRNLGFFALDGVAGRFPQCVTERGVSAVDKLRDLYRERTNLRAQVDIIYDLEDDLMNKRHKLNIELNSVKDKILEEELARGKRVAKVIKTRETIETTN